jgi:HNH endonuclease
MKKKAEGTYLYGNVGIAKSICPNCKHLSFVKKGKSVCCDIVIENTNCVKAYRISEPVPHRHSLSKKQKDEILKLQNDCCYYCEHRLGSQVMRKNKSLFLQTHFDHVIPFSYSQNNEIRNMVAACHVCNAIKYSKIFDDIYQAREYLSIKRKQKGYDF